MLIDGTVSKEPSKKRWQIEGFSGKLLPSADTVICHAATFCNTVQESATALQADVIAWLQMENKSSTQAQLLCKSLFLFAKTMSITLDRYFSTGLSGKAMRQLFSLFAPQLMDADYIKTGHTKANQRVLKSFIKLRMRQKPWLMTFRR